MFGASLNGEMSFNGISTVAESSRCAGAGWGGLTLDRKCGTFRA